MNLPIKDLPIIPVAPAINILIFINSYTLRL